MKATQSTYRHTRESLVHWTLAALVALAVLTLVVLVHALSSSVAQGADISAGTCPRPENAYTNESAQVEGRIDNELQRKVMQLVPLAP